MMNDEGYLAILNSYMVEPEYDRINYLQSVYDQHKADNKNFLLRLRMLWLEWMKDPAFAQDPFTPELDSTFTYFIRQKMSQEVKEMSDRMNPHYKESGLSFSDLMQLYWLRDRWGETLQASIQENDMTRLVQVDYSLVLYSIEKVENSIDEDSVPAVQQIIENLKKKLSDPKTMLVDRKKLKQYVKHLEGLIQPIRYVNSESNEELSILNNNIIDSLTNFLIPYFDSSQLDELRRVLRGKIINAPLLFLKEGNKLTDVFYRARKAGCINCQKKVLDQWICDRFQYTEDGTRKRFNLESVKKDTTGEAGESRCRNPLPNVKTLFGKYS